MVKIFFDKQGNVQLADEFLIGVAANQPDMFGLAEITEEEYENIKQGWRYIDGKVIAPPKAEERELTPEETKEELDKEYRAQLEKYKDALTVAMLSGDKEAIESIKQEFGEFKEAYNQMLEGDEDESKENP